LPLGAGAARFDKNRFAYDSLTSVKWSSQEANAPGQLFITRQLSWLSLSSDATTAQVPSRSALTQVPTRHVSVLDWAKGMNYQQAFQDGRAPLARALATQAMAALAGAGLPDPAEARASLQRTSRREPVTNVQRTEARGSTAIREHWRSPGILNHGCPHSTPHDLSA